MPKFCPEKRVKVIACPFNGGQPKSGVELGPSSLIENNVINQLRELEWTPELVNLEIPFLAQDPSFGIVKQPRKVGNVCKKVKEAVADALKDKCFALTLGGDHSLGTGTVSGTAEAFDDFCLIWVDAHADINTCQTTGSGNLHGMPVAFLMGLITEKVPGFEWLNNAPLRKDRIAYIGLRDVDSGEKKILKENGIKAFSMHEVDKYGIWQVIQKALDHINPNRDLPIHLSFDVDAFDPTVAPSTGTPVRGGLTFREGHFICEALYETGLLVALDVMEVNPTLGDETQRQQTIQIGCSLIRSSLGETLL